MSSRLFLCLYLASLPGFASLSWRTSAPFLWIGQDDNVLSINGSKITKIDKLSAGTSGVQRLRTETGTFYRKKIPMYVAHEAIDSVLGSYLLEWLSGRAGLSKRFPNLYFAVNKKTGTIDGILSKELSGYQTIGSLYSPCKHSATWKDCREAGNLKNIFYQDALIKDPLSLFYNIVLFLGIGDLNPGNVCSNFNQSSAENESSIVNVGLVDIDAILKMHADADVFERVKLYCAQSSSVETDHCARNLLNFYGYNPIALKNRHTDPNEIYFLETGDSALRGNKNEPRTKSIYSDSLCGEKIKSCEIDPYNCRCYMAMPPIDVSAIKRRAANIVQSFEISELLEIVDNFIKDLEELHRNNPMAFSRIIRHSTNNGGVDIFNSLRSNSINLLKTRHETLCCFSKSNKETFFDLEQECSVKSDSNIPLDRINQEERKEAIRMAFRSMGFDSTPKESSWESWFTRRLNSFWRIWDHEEF